MGGRWRADPRPTPAASNQSGRIRPSNDRGFRACAPTASSLLTIFLEERSDPVPQPVTPSRSVADLHALLAAAGQTGPFVLAAHSYGGPRRSLLRPRVSRREVAGMVLVDSFSPELREAMPEAWPSWIAWNTTPAAIVEDYPDYERVDFDEALDEVVANRTIAPMPLVVLTADKPYPAPTQPGLPADINTVTRDAQDVSQRQVAQLVPGAEHITETRSSAARRDRRRSCRARRSGSCGWTSASTRSVSFPRRSAIGSPSTSVRGCPIGPTLIDTGATAQVAQRQAGRHRIAAARGTVGRGRRAHRSSPAGAPSGQRAPPPRPALRGRLRGAPR